jgi:hypothetical protein
MAPMTTKDFERIKREVYLWQDENVKDKEMDHTGIGLANFIQSRFTNFGNFERYTRWQHA